jgi:aspartate 1-decarboxylase
MEAANLKPYERVEVNAVHGRERLVTYVIPGRYKTGQVEMNGGMANFFKEGDEVHVNCFYYLDANEHEFYSSTPELPYIVYTDENNKIID